MAREWIKLEHGTIDKPEVYAIARKLKIPHEKAVVLLLRYWLWLDLNSRDGSVTQMFAEVLDSVVRHSGFTDALLDVEWLRKRKDGSIWTPNYDRHNGKTAKTRALAAQRMVTMRASRERNGSDDPSVTNPSPEVEVEVKAFKPSLTHDRQTTADHGHAVATQPNGNGKRSRPSTRLAGTNPRAAGTNPKANGKRGAPALGRWWLTEAATVALAATLNVAPIPGEDWQTLRARLRAELAKRGTH